MDGKKQLLLAASGSVAKIKLPNIVLALAKQQGLSISLVLTEWAEIFLLGQNAPQLMLKSLDWLPNVVASTMMRMNGKSLVFVPEAFAISS